MDADDALNRSRSELSESLLKHAQSGQTFLGFISYRRADGQALAHWLRRRLTGFAPPRELNARIAAADASVGGPQNRVFLDMSYQRPNVDFWDEHIGASLCRSRTLLLLQTPSVFERLDNGASNWCEREIETFLSFSGDPSRVLVVMGPGAPIDRFPAPLARISTRWDWIDLRFFNASPLRRLQHAHEYDAQLAKILAKIYDIADGDLPLLNREFARVRARARSIAAGAAIATIAGLSGLTTWAMIERGEALRQRNTALIAQSRFLSGTADRLTADGGVRAAVAVLREGLPDPAEGRERPLVVDAVASTYRALFNNHEQGRMAMPADASAVATDGHGGRIVIAAGAKLYVRDGFGDVDARVLANEFSPTKMSLAPDREGVAMIGRDGAIAFRAFSAERTAWSQPGLGTDARIYFLAQGKRLLIVTADATALRLLDSATGAMLAETKFARDGVKPLTVAVDEAADRIYAITQSEVQRLSPETLAAQARAPIDDAEEYAAVLSPDKGSLYVAAAQRLLKGRVFEFDADALTQKRAFGSLAWGARNLVIDKRGVQLAVNSLNGVDFFNLTSGERIYRVFASQTFTGGAFLGRGDIYYLGYGPQGAIRRWTVDLGSDAGAYTNFDGATLAGVDVLPDGSGFLAVSDRPAVTRWSFDAATAVRTFTTPAVIRGQKLAMDWSIRASSVSDDGLEATAAYLDGSIRCWALPTGVAQVLRDGGEFGKDSIAQIVTLRGGVTAAAFQSGKVETYRAGAGAPLGSVEVGPLTYLGAIAADEAFAISATGAALRIGLKDPGKPSVETLSPAKTCNQGASIEGYYYCVGAPGAIRIFSSDGGKPVDIPAPQKKWSYIDVTRDHGLVVVGDFSGRVTLSKGDGTFLRAIDLTTQVRGPALDMAVKALHLPPPPAGASSQELGLPPLTVATSRDGRRIAVGLFLGALKLIDTDTGRVREVRPVSGVAQIEHVAFSRDGSQLAVIASGQYRAFSVYDFETGVQLLSLAHDGVKPDLYELGDGRGFTTVDTGGKIEVFPLYERTEDLLAVLAKEFPDRLTPAQKRAFYIE